MASVISYLQDAKTVAKFQRLCGIVKISNASVEGRGAVGRCRSACEDINGFQTLNKGISPTLLDSIDVTSASNRLLRTTNQSLDYEVTNRFLYYLFHFGANLGNEIFYMTFFPFWFWNIDGYVGRQLCTFWCIFMYIGQATKDVVKLPRPASPPVVQLEKRYAFEYGMPSTHAMVGAGIPFAIYFLTRERYIVSNCLINFKAIAMYTKSCTKSTYFLCTQSQFWLLIGCRVHNQCTRQCDIFHSPDGDT